MKRFLLKISAFALLVGVLASCEEEKITYDVNNGQGLAGFSSDAANLKTFNPQEVSTPSEIEVEVGISTKADHDRVVEVVVNDELTDALPSQYTLEPGPYVIPAGEFTTTIKVIANYDALPATETVTLTLDLVSVEGMDVLDTERSRYMISIFRVCPRDIPLNYTAFVTGEVGSGTPEFTVALTEVDGVATFSTPNLWGNFVAGATGNPAYNGQYPYPAILTINCNNTVTVENGNSDADYATGGTGTFDPNTNEFQLSLNQELFQDSFTADIYLLPNP